jgi:RNA polymerase sigma-70 factor (ECF subfamily)
MTNVSGDPKESGRRTSDMTPQTASAAVPAAPSPALSSPPPEQTPEPLLLVWRKASLFDPSIAGASTWIFAIARNQRIDRIRRERRFTQLEDHMLDGDAAEAPKGDETVYAAQTESRLHDAIQDLPEQQVEVLKLSFFENRSHSEIATHLKLPVGTVKSRLRLAFGKLRASLEDIWE